MEEKKEQNYQCECKRKEQKNTSFLLHFDILVIVIDQSFHWNYPSMSDDEISTNNPMDVDRAPNDSSSSPSVPTTTTSGVVLDLGIGSGYISGSDDEHDTIDNDQTSAERKERVTSKTSTPDSTTLSSTTTRKPTTTKKTTLIKRQLFFLKNFFQKWIFAVADKSSLVSYDRDSDDDEHTEEEEEEEMDQDNEEPEREDEDSNSNSASIAHASGDKDSGQREETMSNEQSLATSDLLNVTPVSNSLVQCHSNTSISGSTF